ncbi:MAG: UDP-N-acetylmuramate--L-alanine ligase [Christensenellaceae bacterium]|jgi:UDP-N-acetylmuramate--alanine ligase|nr:UDP-N-acetylmuramate--L-alanine ligase [Christensenellaceae bacterium]
MLNLNDIKQIHFTGIGGISMSSLAKLMILQQKKVTGSDSKYSDSVAQLNQWGARISIGYDLDLVKSADLMVYSTAIDNCNKELEYARHHKINHLSRSKFLSVVSSNFDRVMAIAGTHGKTTVTGMISNIFLKACLSFTSHIGGFLKSNFGNLIYRGTDYFITEACEYKRAFLDINPCIAVVLDVEYDHPDTYPNLYSVYESFDRFISGIKKNGTLIINAQSNYYVNKTILDVKSKFPADINILTFGSSKCTDFSLQNSKLNSNGCFSGDIYDKSHIMSIKLQIPGYHNLCNALAAYASCRACNISYDHIKHGLESFQGIERRFETYTAFNGATIIVDYAHHPTEITAVINSVINLPHNKLICVFQPHTFSRTKYLLNEFISSFAGADMVFIFKEYSARETPKDGISAAELFAHIKHANIKSYYFENVLNLASQISDIIKPADKLLILGAGDIDVVAKLLL